MEIRMVENIHPLIGEVIFTAIFLIVIIRSTSKGAPAGMDPRAYRRHTYTDSHEHDPCI